MSLVRDASERSRVELAGPITAPEDEQDSQNDLSGATERVGPLALCGCAGLISIPRMGLAGSARDYLNAPIDTWLTFYNFGDFTSVTPEDGLDVTSSVRTNVLSQSVVITRTMDFGVALGGSRLSFPTPPWTQAPMRFARRTRASRMSAFSCR